MGRDLVGRTSKPSLGLIFFGVRKILRKLEKNVVVELDVRLKIIYTYGKNFKVKPVG